MKGYATASAPPSKRRWKGLALAVIVLVFFSLLVPLVFLLGVHNRFPYGYLSDESSTPDSSLRRFDEAASYHDQNHAEVDRAKIVDNLIRRFGPSISKDVGNSPKGANGDSYIEHTGSNVDGENLNSPESKSSSEAGGSTSKAVKQEPLSSPTRSRRNPVQRLKSKGLVNRGDETEKPCQLEFGSYCLWSVEHKEEMKDSMVKKLKDQLFVARSYYPTIAKLQSQEQFSRELKQNIQDHERMLSEAVVDADLPLHVEDKIQKMEKTIARAKTFHVECSNVDKKLRQILDLTEDEAHFHMRQSSFLYHLGVQTMPKSLHCLSMRLTVEHFKSPSLDKEHAHLERLVNPALQHYIIFSKNILASSVAVNSTVMNCKESGNLVFHLLTDSENYFSMKFWFSRNVYKDAVIHVQNIEDYVLENVDKLGIHPYLSFSEEFRISIRSVDQPSSVHTRTEYISVFSHAYFLLPDLFKELKRIIVLDDDVVVQHDLSPLWNLDLKGKVNGAVEFCEVQLGHLKSYFGEKNYDKDMCLWISGLSVVDLDMWRDLNITGTYQQLLHKHMRPQKRTQASWRTAAVATSILAFRDHVFALNGSWVLSGLGTNYGVDPDAIKNAAVLHYNGNMKPWLELGIPKYKSYWRNFLTRHNLFMDECNVNP
ncbi:hypothetical protein Taro_032582 [Colocasia esculenta]|uniref:Hexosyltransferase n=1 Tax=Colocasia esculenta TaxID=4460 RepID=A0A843VRP6_COLES|nr:hypothetical protein [Colocasia esculenta]